jgi:hypothetical protein
MSDNQNSCPECGIAVSDGRVGCEALFDQIRYQVMSEPRIAVVHDLAFDTYCMQHIDTYCVSAKSYMAHLTRLCVGIEYASDPAIYVALQRVYSDKPLVKPEVLPLEQRGTLHLDDVIAIEDIPARVAIIRKWAANVWASYESQHGIARQFIQTALSHKPKR